MRTSQNEFHPMRGHVIDGMEIVADNGDILHLSASMYGWVIHHPNGQSEPLPNAAYVEHYVINYRG